MTRTLSGTTMLYTVYQTPTCIEIHPGCQDYHSMRVICTSVSYEGAYDAAYASSLRQNLPIIDYVTLQHQA